MNIWMIRDGEPKDSGFNSYREAGAVELAAAIIERAVIDWQTLDYGKLKRAMGKQDNNFVYAKEVEAFFHSQWFEYLLSLTLPLRTPQEVREALKIREPRRKKRCEKC